MAKLDLEDLTQAVIDAAWIQWASLGSFVDSKRAARSIIDPEALLLVSLSLRHRERRLWDVLGSWASNGSKLFSIQRVKNLSKRFPEQAYDRLAEFANIALFVGKDHRWRKMASTDPGPKVRNPELWRAHPSTWDPTALIVRLRLGIGVGTPSDLLAFLLSLRGDWAGARTIAEATDYSIYSIRRAADNMAAGQLIEKTREKPVQYRADADAWMDLLGIENDLPEWRYWQKIYSFSATLIQREESSEFEGKSPYMTSSGLRDLMEDYGDVLDSNNIRFADPQSYPGDKYLPAFEESLARLAQWIRDWV
jgi:hypothetical protein